MFHYKIRSSKDVLQKLFRDHMLKTCFCIDSENPGDDGLCEVIIITWADEVIKILDNHFNYLKLEYSDLGYLDELPYYYRFERIGNEGLL